VALPITLGCGPMYQGDEHSMSAGRMVMWSSIQVDVDVGGCVSSTYLWTSHLLWYSSLDIQPLKMGLPWCPTMLGTNHPVVSYNIPEEQRVHLLHCESLKTCKIGEHVSTQTIYMNTYNKTKT
jgi:hypothetical protein